MIGGLTGLMLGSLGDQCACPRHLLCRGAFSLHCIRRMGFAFLQPSITGIRRCSAGCTTSDGYRRLGDPLHRVQSLYFSHVHSGTQGNAPQILRLSSRIYNGHMISSIGAGVLLIGIALMAYNLVRSLKKGAPAPANPWREDLEWTVASPPPPENFDQRSLSHKGPMNISKPYDSVRIHRDDIGAKLGMWIFIFTEMLLFGGLFLVYAVYRPNTARIFISPHIS